MTMDSSVLSVAVAQAESIPGDLKTNVDTCVRLAIDAAARGASLVVFGELFLPGYHPPTLERQDIHVTAAEDGSVADDRLQPLAETAARHEIRVLVGAAVRCGAQRYIATLLVDSSGAIREVYRKQNLCGPEELALFSPGERGCSLMVHQWRLGLGICYDATFPEHARAAADDGCLAYVTGGAFVAGGEHRRELYHAARALDNTCYVVFADALGGPWPWSFSGGSAVYGPEGVQLVRVGEGVEGVAVAELQASEVARVRREHTMLVDRKSSMEQRVDIQS